MGKKTAPKTIFPEGSARYNVASWTSENDNVFLISREIVQKSKGDEPDFTKLVIVELDKNLRHIGEEVVWEASSENLYLEDPRARLSGNSSSVIIGLTALLRGGKGEYIPYPAITKLPKRHWHDILPSVTIIEKFGPGKNTTPVEDDVYFFRQNDDENSHRLLVFSLTDMVPKKLQYLEFPSDLPWAQYRIGTAMPPIWIEPEKALMIFHGISVIEGKYVYSLGRAALIKHDSKYEIRIDPDPLVTPEYFKDSEGNYLVQELHPDLRKVVYCCGGILKPSNKNILILFVNVGDMNTFLVEYPVTRLTKDLF